LYAMDQPTITAEDVAAAVPASSPDAANFGIADAIKRNDAREALRQLRLVLDEGAEPYFVLGQIRYAAEQLPAAHLSAGIDAVFRTDVALKSSGGDPRILLERLVVELCEEGRRGGRPFPSRTSHGPRY